MTDGDESLRDPEVASIERALAVLEGGEIPLADRDAPLVREYVELLGLLPVELEPVAAPPGLGEALGRSLAGRDDALPEVASLPPRPARPAAGQSGAVGRWLLPLAASLALLSLGLSGWLYRELGQQRAQVEDLSRALDQAQRTIGELATNGAGMAAMRERLELVTEPRVEICALRPTGEEPLHPAARGLLYVSEDRRGWYLKLFGLQPCPAGHVYQVWFQVGGRAVSAGTFEVQPGGGAELASGELLRETEAVFVTMEPDGGMPEPTGPRILFGNEVMHLL